MFVLNDIIFADDVIAVGDIHGMARLYFQFLDWVKGTGARVILLGDLMDRGEDDLTVLNRTRDLIQDPEGWGLRGFTALLGNHEQMFINAVDGYGYDDWVRNGGDWENFDNLKPHAEWLRELPYYVTVGDTMFAHAGCFPGKNPRDNMFSFTQREQFLWNRGAFLVYGPEFEKWNPNLKEIVFGHTPKGPLPYRIPNGICIDTAAYDTGILTAYNATTKTFHQFEQE